MTLNEVWEQVQALWEFVLITPPGGQPITVGQVVLILILLVVGYFVSRLGGFLLARRLSRTELRPDTVQTLKRIVFLTALVLLFLIALQILGIPISAFAFAVGAIAVGIGLGAQNIINNYISGWILLSERPIRIDDFIEFDNWQGFVEHIGHRSTRIRRTDGVHLVVPNSHLLERTVINWALIDQEVRGIVRVGVVYGSPIRQVSQLVLQAVTEHPKVKREPGPSVVFEDFGDSALIFDAYFWCIVTGDKMLREIRGDIRLRIADLFEEQGIVVAFPQRDVHLDTPAPLDVRIVPES